MSEHEPIAKRNESARRDTITRDKLSEPTKELRATGVNTSLVDMGVADLGAEAQEFLLAERPRFVRGTLYLSILLLATAGTWAALSRMDITVVAPGVVRPRGDVEPVQSPVTGMIEQIFVHEGQQVEKGQLLLRFERAPLQLELDKVDQRIRQRQAEERDADELVDFLRKSYDAQRVTRETDIEQAKQDVENQTLLAERELEQKKARRASAEARLKASKERVTEAEQQVAKLERGVREGVVKGSDLDDARRQVDSAKRDRDVVDKELIEADVACKLDETPIKAARYRLALKEKALKELLAEREIKDKEARTRVTQAKAEIDALAEERKGADLRLRMSEVHATKSGLVTSLPFPTEKRHVGEGATVATISPTGCDLILKAWVKNSDRANVRVGQGAKIRFAAFPYQEYGAIEGKVTEISADVVKPDQSAASQESGYELTISIATTEITSNRGEKKSIQLGYVARADIVVDERPVIFVLLSELKKLFDTRAQ